MQKDEIAIIKLHRALVNAEVLLHVAVDVDSSLQEGGCALRAHTSLLLF